MSSEVEKEILIFIENALKNNSHKHLFVYWFGGEPLLCIDAIRRMSRCIIAMAKKYGVSYSSAMSTNGYYLTEENASILEECHLSRIQVTLDGMKEINDKTRVLKDGRGTFDVIVSNLKKIKVGFEIHIRTNLNKENAEEFSKLESLVKEIKRINGLNISLYGAHMSVYEFNNDNVDALELSMKEYSDLLKKNKMIGINKNSNLRFAFCDAAKMFSFCFDDKGNMYKCWNDIGNIKYSYDNVIEANRRGINYAAQNALDYLARSFPEECKGCKVLPICMGGCIKKRVIEKNKTCSPVKYNLDDYVMKKYLILKGGEYYESAN